VYEPLDVVVSTEYMVAEPGATQRLDLQVFGSDGAGVENAEVSISVFDESLSIFESDDSNNPEDLAPDHFFSIYTPSQPFEPPLHYSGGGYGGYGTPEGYYGEDVIFLNPFMISTPELDKLVSST